MDRGAKLAVVKRIRIHGLRHSHMSLLINLGFPALGERVGHEAVDITYLFDRIGLAALILSTLCSAFFSCFIFLSGNSWMIGVGIILWGVGMGAQESIIKAAVSKIISKSMRSSGFGITWFLESWLLVG